MSGPSKPSGKGYAPVPTEERIDDDVETPQNDNEGEGEDDDLYTTSAPLLSARSRGNEPPSEGQLCWYHKIFSFRPFRRRERRFSAWDPPKKPRNWRRILVFSITGFFLAVSIGLSISTGVLANKLHSAETSRDYCWRHNGNRYSYYQNTRVPLNQGWISSNNNLNFVRLYPPLRTGPSSACQAAWNTLTNVPCHEKIWNRSWDNGKHGSLFDPDISLYTHPMCSSRCSQAINTAFQLISTQCTEEDKFDMDNWVGTFTADPGLEDGPIGVMETIARRLAHTCRRSPAQQRNYWEEKPFCASVMWEDWFIVDGMNAGNLEGLDVFDRRTKTWRSEQATYKSPMTQDSCDNVDYGISRFIPARRFGPGVNETTCDWCTLNWFERKLVSWRKDEVLDPKTGKAVGLKNYLLTIRLMGQRCDADAWDRVWERSIQRYKRTGQLPDDWDKKGKTGNGMKDQKPEFGVGDGEKVQKPDVEDTPVHIWTDEELAQLDLDDLPLDINVLILDDLDLKE